LGCSVFRKGFVLSLLLAGNAEEQSVPELKLRNVFRPEPRRATEESPVLQDARYSGDQYSPLWLAGPLA